MEIVGSQLSSICILSFVRPEIINGKIYIKFLMTNLQQFKD